MRLLNVMETADHLRISRRSLYRRLDDPGFPEPRRVGRRVVFVAEEIDDWVDGQTAGDVEKITVPVMDA